MLGVILVAVSLFVICLGFVLGASKIGLSMEMSMIISFTIIALWWFLFNTTTFKNIQTKVLCRKTTKAISNNFKRLGNDFKNIRKEKKIFLFLLAFSSILMGFIPL